jgi:glucose-6-phosphate 1-epimerase
LPLAPCTVGALDALRLTHPEGAEATVLLHGGHVVSWRPASDDERLFVSREARLAPDSAVRGGVPVIFPQFADRGPLPKHGFARTTRWRHKPEPESTPETARAILRLEADDETLALWPHRFRAEVAVELLAHTLDIALTVWNCDRAPLAFTAALHTYLAVGDVRRAQLRGLRGARYESRVAGEAPGTETRDPLGIEGEADRVYLDAPWQLVLDDTAAARKTILAQRGFRDTVLWNPGPEKARALPDLADDEWTRMLCVEAALVGSPAQLAHGEAWTGGQTLTAV